MKNIIILNGNPDPENTGFDKNLEQLKILLINSGNKTDELNLRSMKLNHCIGCYSCWVKTPGLCVFRDDCHIILKKYINSDIVIFASPVIAGFFSALLQIVIERLLPLVHPYFQMTKGACQHLNRYDKYPAACLVLGKNKNYGPEFTNIIDSICRSKKTRIHLFTKILDNKVKEIADEINCF